MKKQSAYTNSPAIASLASIELEEGIYKSEPIVNEETISIDAVIRFLKGWKNTIQDSNRHVKQLEKELRDKEEELHVLRQDNQRLYAQVNEVQSDYRVVNDDYKALIQIMDRARRLAFLNEKDEDSKSKFKMDANGNLERIE
ncbi:Prespore-specific transcriptional regulator RsfA [compost metagenome]